ncbi:alpha/beta hydrolase [Alicyclobacillus macrosporangiidus]|uniref:Enterochelin esterase n=1 Tax=Alicyclobacillus macrosporangiidus TaxID=392015 RepID=A0A1I7K3H0_9BACL|nr:alpha/beta hydrolase-fold protein [Alicyclobacillus macrosporangiidus]SFU91978.1 Enterochelin esterase [Alicyclobacillus macrosporangiidus]
MSHHDPTRRTIETHTLYSAHLHEDRTLKVYLPPGYDPANRYPLLYCHDGLEFFTHGRIATIANRMLEAGEIQPLVIVGIAVNKARRNDDYGPDGARREAYTRFVLEECMPFIEDRYAAGGRPAMRFMAGVSLGAAISLSIHLDHPVEFRRLLLFSGAFYRPLLERVEAAEDLSGLEAFMVVGTEETAVETNAGARDFLALNREMRTRLERAGANVTYQEDEGRHIWGFWQRKMPEALAWLQAARMGG